MVNLARTRNQSRDASRRHQELNGGGGGVKRSCRRDEGVCGVNGRESLGG